MTILVKMILIIILILIVEIPKMLISLYILKKHNFVVPTIIFTLVDSIISIMYTGLSGLNGYIIFIVIFINGLLYFVIDKLYDREKGLSRIVPIYIALKIILVCFSSYLLGLILVGVLVLLL